jgi:hypothetical protein
MVFKTPVKAEPLLQKMNAQHGRQLKYKKRL